MTNQLHINGRHMIKWTTFINFAVERRVTNAKNTNLEETNKKKKKAKIYAVLKLAQINSQNKKYKKGKTIKALHSYRHAHYLSFQTHQKHCKNDLEITNYNANYSSQHTSLASKTIK